MIKLHSSEIKVLVISIYYAITILVIVTTATVHKIQDLEQLTNDITNYFMCEATGTLRECDKPTVDLYRRIISLISFTLIGLFPIVNLIYVLNIRELKKKILSCFPKSERQLLRKGTGTSAVETRSSLSSEY